MASISAKFVKPKGFLFFIASLMLLASGCDGPNTDANEEISCSAAKGAWILSKVYCDGQRLASPKFSAVRFTDDVHMDWTLGSADCQKKVTNVYHLTQANLDIYGTSFFSCSANGASTSTCSGMQASCSDSTPGSLNSHNIPKCSIYYGSLKLGRTATTTMSNQGLTFCQPGENEEIFFTRQLPGSAALTFSSGYGYSFPEPILPQQISEPVRVIMTNRGSTDATNVSPQIDKPFEFVDGIYPGKDENGDDGTCTSVLPALSECSFYIRFRPEVVGKVELNMPIHFSNGSGTVTTYFKLAGIGEQPLAELTMLSHRPLDFGTLLANTTSRRMVHFRNDGTGPAFNLKFTEIVPPFYYPVTDEYPGGLGTCDSFVGIDEECEVEIEFRPEGPGIFAHTIELSYENGIVSEQGVKLETIEELEIKARAVTAGP